MSGYEHPSLRALDEIEDLLEAYADAHLAPTSPVLARMRRAVMMEAAAVSATRAAERRAAEGAPQGPLSWLPRLRMPRPVFAAGFAAVLAVSTGAAVLAAPAGSPFYNARVALETMFLPTQLDARLASHEELLEERLAEAEAAAARGDIAALEAALAAFQDEMDAAVADVGDDYDRLSRLEAVLQRHIDKLNALAARLPTQVARDNAVEHAIEASERGLGSVKEKKAKSNSRPDKPPGQDSNPQNRS